MRGWKYSFPPGARMRLRKIMDAACSGIAGDGIVAVLPVGKIYKIRHRAEMLADESIR